MDNLDTLFSKKEYELVINLTKDSKDPKELFLRISSFVVLGKTDEALDEIEKHQSIIEAKYQLKLMKLHFELLLSKKLYDDARLALKHYENLPYVSQEVEEFMKEMKERIEEESHPKQVTRYEPDEMAEILEKETENGKLSQVLFSLKEYNINIYIDSLKVFLVRPDVNPNFRTYALLLLLDQKYDGKVKFLSRNGVIEVVPKDLPAPFMTEIYNNTCRLIVEKANSNVSLINTGLHLFNCYIVDVYPSDVYSPGEEVLSSAFITIGEMYIGQEISSKDEKVIKLANEIKEIIESTPEIKL